MATPKVLHSMCSLTKQRDLHSVYSLIEARVSLQRCSAVYFLYFVRLMTISVMVDQYEMVSAMRRHHVCKSSRGTLATERNAVAVLQSSTAVGHVPRAIS